MMVYSAWLWLVSSMSTTTCPVYSGKAAVPSASPSAAIVPAPLL